jgi:hypothetical protein
MKSDLLSLHLLYQLLDPIKYWLIRDAGCQNTVMLDLTQGHRREATDQLLSYDGDRAILFQSNTVAITLRVSEPCGLR